MKAKRYRTEPWALRDVPEELRHLDTWVCYWRKGPGFVLINPLSGIQVHPKTGPIFGTFKAVLFRLAQDPDLDGIGLVLTPQDPYAVVKLPESELPEQLFAEAPPRTYVEFSPNGSHWHFWIKLAGEAPPLRYLTTTGFVPLTGAAPTESPNTIMEMQFAKTLESGDQYFLPIGFDDLLDKLLQWPEDM